MKKSIVLNQSPVGQKSAGALKSFFKNISPFNNKTDMSPALLVLKKVFAFYLCYWTGILIAEGLVIGGLFAYGKNFLHGEMFSDDVMMLIKLYGMIVVIASSVIYWKLIEKRKLSKMGVTRSIGGWLIGAGVGILLLIVSVSAIIVTGTIKFVGVSTDLNISMLMLMLGGYIVQGAAEEFLSRGVVFHGLKDKVPMPVAVGANALVFTLPHLSTLSGSKPQFIISGVINLAVISCLFSFITLRTKSIWAACGLHSLWNFCLSCVLGLTLTGSEGTTSVINMRAIGGNLLNGGIYGIEASIITAAAMAVAAILIWYSYKKGNTERQA
jgi:hypothetical protein